MNDNSSKGDITEIVQSPKSRFLRASEPLIKEMIDCGMKERIFTMDSDFDIIIRDRKRKARKTVD